MSKTIEYRGYTIVKGLRGSYEVVGLNGANNSPLQSKVLGLLKAQIDRKLDAKKD
jgi:hypothetical protein